MKRRQWIKRGFLGIVYVMAAMFAFAGCGVESEKLQVCILDGQTETRLLVEEGTTVKQVLAEAEISVGKKDVIEPSWDSVLSKDVTEISVERFARVSVAAEGQAKEFALTGGKVSDVLEAAKIKLEETDSVNHDLDACLTDGMSIEIVHNGATKVALDRKGDDSAKGEKKEESDDGNSERKIVSKEKIYDCDGSGHGYYSITWSDGSVEYEDF